MMASERRPEWAVFHSGVVCRETRGSWEEAVGESRDVKAEERDKGGRQESWLGGVGKRRPGEVGTRRPKKRDTCRRR